MAPASDNALISESSSPPSGPTTRNTSSALASGKTGQRRRRRFVKHRNHSATGNGVTNQRDPPPASCAVPQFPGRTRVWTALPQTLPHFASVRRPWRAWGPSPLGDTTQGLPRDHRVDPRLGRQFDGQLGTLGLGKCLNEGHQRLGLLENLNVTDQQFQAVLADARHLGVGHPGHGRRPNTNRSPTPIRRTVAAWRPSCPSRTAISPTPGTGSRKKTVAATVSGR